MAKTVNKSSKNPKKTAAVGDLFASMEKSQRSSGKTSGERAARAHAPSAGEAGYTAKHIEVLEGLEPVRRRPGMYIGGTDEKALHHLFAEVIDNAMDEALAGHATFIEVELDAEGFVSVTDNGRGIPVDPHPKFKNKSALEVIMCTLARRRQVRLQGVRHLGRLARRRRLGRQRAVRPHGGRGRARPEALQDGVRARQAEGQAAGRRQGAEPARHHGALPSRPGDFRAQGAFPARARVQDDALEGLSVRRRRNPLVLRQGNGRRHRRAGEGDVPFRGRAEGLSLRDAEGRDADQPRDLQRPVGQGRQARRRAMGRRLDRRRRWLPQLLLQHHSDAGRRHPRVRHAHGAVCAG